jgi:hypothetical protein
MLTRVCMLVCAAAPLVFAAAAAGSLVLKPRKLIERGPDLLARGPVVIKVSPQAGEVERYAAERLATLLEARFGLKARMSQRAASSAPVTVWLGTPAADESLGRRLAELGARVTASDPGKEGFRIRVRRGGRGIEVAIAGSDPSGLLYGALALPQLLRKVADDVAIRQVDVDDSPAAPVRAMYVIPQRLGRGWGGQADSTHVGTLTDPAVYRHYLDWLAENRINLVSYEVARDVRLPDGLADLVREAHRRAIRVFGGVRYVGSWRTSAYICASDSAQVEQVLRIYDAFLDAGCDGVTYMADDIAPAYLTGHCDRCRERFGGLAGEQVFLLRKIAQRALECGISASDIYFCPTYYSQYDGEHRDYFLAFAQDPILRQIPFFMTFYDAPQIQRFRADTGLDYIWWYNGPRSISYFNRGKARYGEADAMYYPLMFGWHGLQWQWAKGFDLPNPQVAKTFANMDKYSRVFWMCCGGGDTIAHTEYAHAMWGIYAWRPAAFRQDVAEESVLSRLMGAEASRSLQRANQESFVAFTAMDPTQAYPLPRIEKAIGDARRAISEARRHYDRFWDVSGRVEYPEAARDFVLNTFARYERALEADERCLRALVERDGALRRAESRRVSNLSVLSRWRLSAEGAWRAEIGRTAIQFSLPKSAPQPAKAVALASIRVSLPRAGAYQVLFSASDSYAQKGTPPRAWPDHIVKQVAVNDKVIWEDDVEGDEPAEDTALQAAQFEGEGEVEIQLRAAVIRDVSNMGVTITFLPIAVVASE